MPFTEKDGDVFRGLGRKEELEHLLGYVLDDQIPLAVVMGESGVGKTSLLRAGLSDALEKSNVRFIYWEALPTNPTDRLLHAVRSGWDAAKDGTAPKNLEEAIEALAVGTSRTVIVLDQFEQLSPDAATHQRFFEALKAFVTGEMPPYRLSWVVAFRRDYDPSWRDFELATPGFHPPMVSLRLFDKDQSRAIMATLASKADFTLDNEFVADVVNAAADSNARVSPVDIGIGMLVLSNLAARTNKRHLGKDDYRFAGGAEGILTAYVSDRLERFGEGEQQGVMKALLALCDLGKNQRIAEGKALDELSTAAQLSPNRLNASLEYLASPHVRLLETLPSTVESPQKYRLTHDRMVASLRRLTGLILVQADQARLAFENAFRGWLNSQSERLLLTGSDLKKVLKNLSRLSEGPISEERERFLKLSLQRRFRQRLLTAGVVLGLAALASLSWREYRVFQAKRDITEAGLPRDLYNYQNQLLALEVTAPVANLGWLHTNRLKRLLVKSPALRDVRGVPASLRELVVSDCRISTLVGLEKLGSLTTLDLSNTDLQSLAGVEKLVDLTTLNLSNCKLKSLTGLEKLVNLTTLKLSNCRLKSLTGLEKLVKLTTLDLSGNAELPSLAGVEKLVNLTTLDLSHGPLSLAGLEKLVNLTALNLRAEYVSSENLEQLSKLDKLNRLDLSESWFHSLTGLESLVNLTTLDLSGGRLYLDSLNGNWSGNSGYNYIGMENLELEKVETLVNLTRLTLSNCGLEGLAGLEKLVNLTALNLSHNWLPSLAGAEKLEKLTTLDLSHMLGLQSLAGVKRLVNLTTLDLSGNTDLQSLAGVERLVNLTTLDLSGNAELQSLAGLEKLVNLTTLNLSNDGVQSLAGFAKLEKLTTLNLSNNGLESLAGVEKLTSLENLDLSGCPIKSLKPLAGLKRLRTLNLRGTKISSLEGLPHSVTELELGD